METFSALLALCAGNSPVTGQRPVTRSFDVFFDLCLNIRLSKQSWGQWLETPSRPLWRHSNVVMLLSRTMLLFIYTPFVMVPLRWHICMNIFFMAIWLHTLQMYKTCYFSLETSNLTCSSIHFCHIIRQIQLAWSLWTEKQYVKLMHRRWSSTHRERVTPICVNKLRNRLFR